MSIIEGKVVAITGGTGSFGQAFARRALDDGAARVVIISRDELKQAKMRVAFRDLRMRFRVGDVRFPDRMTLALRDVDLLVHAAAMKRIEVCEAEPWETVLTNVIGTHHVAQAALENGIDRAVFLSTDKSPAAHTLYGATKFCAERLWVQSNVYAAGRRTRFSATRYGNVLGSRGSVLELWRQQREAGEPLTLTDERMTRYWMLLSQGVDLVVTALTAMRGGELFIPKVGSASALDLARAVVGPDLYAPGHVVTGLRPGERMHETLISADESRTTYDAGTHYVVDTELRSWEDAAPLDLMRVPEGWTYRSDTNPHQYTVPELGALVEPDRWARRKAA